ncbi:hypothetical protein H0H93_006202 [Arthromyces matolae]|nr:hypothetical protein H0H93_006202 [Arthromyces matolae]
MWLFTICLIIQSLASSLFANPIPIPKAHEQKEAPWFLSSLTVNPPEMKKIDTSATGPFFYRELTGVNIYYIGARVDIEADDLRGFAHVLDVFATIECPLDAQATYAAALAVGKTWGVARGAHLYSLPIYTSRGAKNERLTSYDLMLALDKVLDHCRKMPQTQPLHVCIVAVPHAINGDDDDKLKGKFDELRASKLVGIQWNDAIINVAPMNEEYTQSVERRMPGCLWVTAANIEISLSSKCNINNPATLNVDHWMAAVLRASGIVASFVYNSWLQNSRTLSPADISEAITNDAFTPHTQLERKRKYSVKVLRIPPEVSGSSHPRDTIGTTASPSPPTIPGGGFQPVTSSHDRDASAPPPPPRLGPSIADLISPPHHPVLWPSPA